MLRGLANCYYHEFTNVSGLTVFHLVQPLGRERKWWRERRQSHPWSGHQCRRWSHPEGWRWGERTGRDSRDQDRGGAAQAGRGPGRRVPLCKATQLSQCGNKVKRPCGAVVLAFVMRFRVQICYRVDNGRGLPVGKAAQPSLETWEWGPVAKWFVKWIRRFRVWILDRTKMTMM